LPAIWLNLNRVDHVQGSQSEPFAINLGVLIYGCHRFERNEPTGENGAIKKGRDLSHALF
jgi:hypothetical protein